MKILTISILGNQKSKTFTVALRTVYINLREGNRGKDRRIKSGFSFECASWDSPATDFTGYADMLKP
jgi:hypothetical protein